MEKDISENKKKRIEELDIAKGLGMLYVVAFHFLDYSSELAYICLNAVSVIFIMIVYFLVSGYTFRSGKTPWQNIKKRIPALLKPFVIYTVIITLLFLLILTIMGAADMSEYGTDLYYLFAGKGIVDMISPGTFTENLSMIPAEPYWFLKQMMLASILFYLLADFVLKSNMNLLIVQVLLFGSSVLMSALCPQLPLDIEVTPAIAGYMLMGAWCGKNRVAEKFRDKVFHPIFIIAAVISAVISVLMCTYFSPGEGLARGYFSTEVTHGLDVMTTLLTSVFSIVPFWWICLLIGKTNIIRKVISWLGENSLSIYLIHMFIGMSIMMIAGIDAVLYDEEIPYQTIIFIAVFAATLALSCLYAVIRNRIIKAFLTRKKKNQ